MEIVCSNLKSHDEKMKNQEMIKIHLSLFHDYSFIAEVFRLVEKKVVASVAVKMHTLLDVP